jgi:hypothetical protein
MILLKSQVAVANAVLCMQSTRLLISHTTCLMGTPTWLPALPVAWLVWLRAWLLALSVMLESGQFLLPFLLCPRSCQGSSLCTIFEGFLVVSFKFKM